MNPFTRALLRRLRSRELSDFVAHWDALEALVIRVYKGKSASQEDEKEHRQLRGWLQKRYPRWQAELQPFWRQKLIGGEPAQEDPFLALLSVPKAGGFPNYWRAMQTLPAAREALNEYLVDRVEKREEK